MLLWPVPPEEFNKKAVMSQLYLSCKGVFLTCAAQVRFLYLKSPVDPHHVL